MLLFSVSLALLFIDHRYDYLSKVRSWLTVVSAPLYWVTEAPFRAISTADELVTSRKELIEENARLKAKNLILEQKVQKLASLTAQNQRLKALLNSSELVTEQVLVAEIIGIDPDPYIHAVLINKGSRDGVFEGQAIVDAKGVMGQVVEVSPFSSRVLLVTDVASRVPVQVNRSGYRSIAAGVGRKDSMELLHIPSTADIREGDLLISSGLGRIYPAGYPLGKVRRIDSTPGDSFIKVDVQLRAEVNLTRFVLLVFRSDESDKADVVQLLKKGARL